MIKTKEERAAATAHKLAIVAGDGVRSGTVRKTGERVVSLSLDAAERLLGYVRQANAQAAAWRGEARRAQQSRLETLNAVAAERDSVRCELDGLDETAEELCDVLDRVRAAVPAGLPAS